MPKKTTKQEPYKFITPVDERFYNAVEVVRIKLGLNAGEASEKMFDNKQMLSKIRSGRQSAPQYAITILVNSHGVDANWIFKGEGTMFTVTDTQDDILPDKVEEVITESKSDKNILDKIDEKVNEIFKILKGGKPPMLLST